MAANLLQTPWRASCNVLLANHRESGYLSPGFYFCLMPLPSLLMLLLATALGSVLIWGWRGRLAARRAQVGGSEELAALRAANAAQVAQTRHVQNQLDEMHRELSSLSYSISHDLRAPLRSIGGFAQALAEDYGSTLDATAHDYLNRVRASTQHMSELIDQMLNLARVVRANFHADTVDLSALAREAADTLSAAEPSRKVEWSIQSGVMARGDKALLGTALRHLLVNAWKFSNRRPVAHLAFRAGPGKDGGTVYQVRDDGVGFDMQYAGKLFGAFQRMHAPDEFPGHGVGLATVQRIVRRHGGSVWAESAPDQGAVFFFTLHAVSEGGAADLTGGSPPVAAAAGNAGGSSSVPTKPTAV